MAIKLIGYSERGMINALADDLVHAANSCGATEQLLSLRCFPL
jgi:hypothetical protein